MGKVEFLIEELSAAQNFEATLGGLSGVEAAIRVPKIAIEENEHSTRGGDQK